MKRQNYRSEVPQPVPSPLADIAAEAERIMNLEGWRAFEFERVNGGMMVTGGVYSRRGWGKIDTVFVRQRREK